MPDAPPLSASSTTPSMCYVELLGPARLQAGLKHLSVEITTPTTIPELIFALAEACPALVGPVLDLTRGRLAEGHVLNRNGRDFLKDRDLIQPGDRLLLMSSSAGG